MLTLPSSLIWKYYYIEKKIPSVELKLGSATMVLWAVVIYREAGEW